MNPTLFLQWVEQYFPGLVTRVVERYNDQAKAQDYLYRRFLQKNFSIDGKWETLTVNNSLVAADIIAMDSSIPLKKRPSLGRASGDIPKLGLELNKREKQLTDLHTLVVRLAGTGANAESTIAAKILDDVPLVIGGQYERLESMFLEGLSSGYVMVDDSETVGTAIRIDYGYRTENAFTSTLPWSNTSATPFSDMARVMDANTSDAVRLVMMDRTTFNNMAKTTEGKAVWASFAGFAGSNLTTPTLSQMNLAVNDRYGFQIEIVDRTVKIERNGVRTNQKPWKPGAVVFLTDLNVGSYVYARLAEQDSPVGGVNYQLADDFILVSKYSMNRPALMEVTNSQSRVVPVIDNPYGIFTLDSTITAS
jgi:hypothetical protein